MLFIVVMSFIFIVVFSLISIHIMNRIDDAENTAQKAKEAARKQKDDDDRERKEKEAFHSKMMGIVNVLNNQVTSLTKLYNQIIDTIPHANNALDNAEDEFRGGFFAPFWDEIETATNQLASYNNYLHGINSCMEQYWKYIQDLDETYNSQVKLCVLPGKLPDPIAVANRLAKTVRMAQKNFEFSTIYEQRKTNKLLYEGFRNLGDAIYSLGDRITDSLNDLSHNLNASLYDILTATNENSRIISDNIDEQTRRIDKHAEAQRSYETDSLRSNSLQQKTLEQQKRVLDSQNRRIDNIQRGRKPGLFDE